MPNRTLSLKREVLQELTATDLHDVVAGTRDLIDPTAMSCLDYISCWAWECLPGTLVCTE